MSLTLFLLVLSLTLPFLSAKPKPRPPHPSSPPPPPYVFVHFDDPYANAPTPTPWKTWDYEYEDANSVKISCFHIVTDCRNSKDSKVYQCLYEYGCLDDDHPQCKVAMELCHDLYVQCVNAKSPTGECWKLYQKGELNLENK